MNLYDLERTYLQLKFIYGISFYKQIIFVKKPMLVGDLVFLKKYMNFFNIKYKDIRIGVWEWAKKIWANTIIWKKRLKI